MIEELKPCPFCGGIPVVVPNNPEEQGNAWAEVKCIENQCQANPSVADGEDIADERGSDAYKSATIKRWNTRTDQEA